MIHPYYKKKKKGEGTPSRETVFTHVCPRKAETTLRSKF